MLLLIETALKTTDVVVANSKNYTENSEIIVNTKKILYLLRKEVQNNPNQINKRVLRAAVDLGMSNYRAFENTPLETAISNISEFLYHSVPHYKDLDQLGMDFGKGDPI